jgi:hypothetical protein
LQTIRTTTSFETRQICMNTHFLVALTINEYQILCRAGELRVDPWCLVVVPKRWREEKPACEFAGASLAERLPELDPEEIHSVLIAEFSSRSHPVVDHVPDGRVWLRIDHCLRIFAIDSSSEPIVASRVGDLGITLDRPILSSSLTPAIERITHRWSVFGGQALVKAVVGVDGYLPSWVDQSSLVKPELPSQIVHRCLEYTRHKSWGPEPLSAIKDLGLILREAGGEVGNRASALDLLRGICKASEGSDRGLGLLLRDRHLTDALTAIQDGWSLPLDPAALVLLLHWLYQGQRADGVDIGAVLGDCEEVRDVLFRDVVCDALWLLGFKAQFGSFSRDWLMRLGPDQGKGKGGKPHRFVELRPRPEGQPPLELLPETDVREEVKDTPKEDSPGSTPDTPGTTPESRDETSDATREASSEVAPEASPKFTDGAASGPVLEVGTEEPVAEAGDEVNEDSIMGSGDPLPPARRSGKKASKKTEQEDALDSEKPASESEDLV